MVCWPGEGRVAELQEAVFRGQTITDFYDVMTELLLGNNDIESNKRFTQLASIVQAKEKNGSANIRHILLTHLATLRKRHHMPRAPKDDKRIIDKLLIESVSQVQTARMMPTAPVRQMRNLSTASPPEGQMRNLSTTAQPPTTSDKEIIDNLRREQRQRTEEANRKYAEEIHKQLMNEVEDDITTYGVHDSTRLTTDERAEMNALWDMYRNPHLDFSTTYRTERRRELRKDINDLKEKYASRYPPPPPPMQHEEASKSREDVDDDEIYSLLEELEEQEQIDRDEKLAQELEKKLNTDQML